MIITIEQLASDLYEELDRIYQLVDGCETKTEILLQEYREYKWSESLK